MTTLTPAQCEEKWAAVLEGLEGAQVTIVAFVLEQEIRHLVDLKEAGTVLPVGERAKIHLPVLRLAVCRLLPVSAVDQLGRLAAWPQNLTVEEVHTEIREAFLRVMEAGGGGPALAWNPGEFGVGSQLRELAERTYESLLAYPGSAP